MDLKKNWEIYHLGHDLAWDWISASYLIKYAHTGRSCDLLIFGIPEVNFLVRAFQFGMKGVLSRIPDISPEFCWIPIFVFFLHFYVFLNWPTPSVGGRSCDLLIFTRGPFWPPGIVIACVCLCVCLCVCVYVCVNNLLVRAITLDPFELESLCGMPSLRPLLILVLIDPALEGKI